MHPSSPPSDPSSLHSLPVESLVRQRAASGVLRCSSTADFLAVLPFVTGFTDEHSLFVVLFRGKRSEDVLRLELPNLTADGTPTDRNEETAFIQTVVELLEVTGAGEESPAFVITTGLGFEECRGVPLLRFARRLQRRVAREMWTLREFAIVASDGWCGLLTGASPSQRDLAEITTNALADEARRISEPPRHLATMSHLPSPSANRAKLVGRALADHAQREQLTSPAMPSWWRELALLVERCVRPKLDVQDTEAAGTSGREADAAGAIPLETDEADLATLIAATQLAERWAIIALTLLTRAAFAIDLVESHEVRLLEQLGGDSDALRENGSLELFLLALSAEEPDSATLRRATQVLADAATHAPDQLRPPVLALLAWVWWMLGLHSVASDLVAQAMQIDECDALTLLVGRLLRCPPAARLQALRYGRLKRQAAAA